MKNRVKTILALASAAVLLSLSACSGNRAPVKQPVSDSKAAQSVDTDQSVDANQSVETGTVYDIYCEDHTSLGTPEKTLDPDKLYSEINYTPENFYGNYQLVGGDSVLDDFKAQADYIPYYLEDRYDPDKEITAIPYQLKAGPNTFSNVINRAKKYHWMEAYFFDKKGNLLFDTCAYEIEGHQLKLTPLKEKDFDTEADKLISYELCDTTLVYDFAFKGTTLTLSTGGKSVTMSAGYNYGTESAPRLFCENYAAPGTATIDGIKEISFLWKDDGNNNRFYVVYEDAEGKEKTIRNGICEIAENGLLTMTIPWEDGEKTYQYLYFYHDDDGITLTDGENTYRYTMDYLDYKTDRLNIDEGDEISALSDSQIDELLQKQKSILEELDAAFKEKGIEADVNKDTGRVNLNNAILFDTDSSELSDEGKAYLKSFTDVYTSVVLSDKNSSAISNIIIEGHTDSDGDYDYNLKLSEDRAHAVADYCTEIEPKLENLITSAGYSYDYPVYKADGTEDKEASRRVVFKFRLTLE